MITLESIFHSMSAFDIFPQFKTSIVRHGDAFGKGSDYKRPNQSLTNEKYRKFERNAELSRKIKSFRGGGSFRRLFQPKRKNGLKLINVSGVSRQSINGKFREENSKFRMCVYFVWDSHCELFGWCFILWKLHFHALSWWIIKDSASRSICACYLKRALFYISAHFVTRWDFVCYVLLRKSSQLVSIIKLKRPEYKLDLKSNFK